jgi:uncharacterized protein (TIGR04255 family)
VTAIRPKFDRPPVVEQAITVVFDELAGFGVGDFGLFWSLIREAFPVCEHAPPVETTLEQLPARPVAQDVRILLEHALPLPRCLYRHASDGEVIQVQKDRFTFNWARAGETPYPHSERTVARFVEMFERFSAFVVERGMGPVNLTQCEVTNVNIVPVADFGRSFADAPAAFLVPALRPEGEVLQPETYMQTVQHLILNQGRPVGRLHVSLQPVISSADQSLAYKLELTARSGRGPGDLTEALEFFDLARSGINSAFLASTTPLMREKWGLQNG